MPEAVGCLWRAADIRRNGKEDDRHKLWLWSREFLLCCDQLHMHKVSRLKTLRHIGMMVNHSSMIYLHPGHKVRSSSQPSALQG